MLCFRIQKNSNDLINAYLGNIIKGQHGCCMLNHIIYCNICNYMGNVRFPGRSFVNKPIPSLWKSLTGMKIIIIILHTRCQVPILLLYYARSTEMSDMSSNADVFFGERSSYILLYYYEVLRCA